ncbi:MAG TPA: toast rack family protein [Candidatus Acidoferrales bacterium]|nr:toast rack family protein [Candidatus Acidoferrales bacterium]
MADDHPRQRGPLTGALLLITAGLLFLYANLRPEWNPWPIISRYWPVLLIVLGLGKLWDVLRAPAAPGAPQKGRRRGESVALLILLILLAAAFVRGRGSSRFVHETKSVDAQHATSVRASVEMSTGELKISGGAAKLLDAAFDYNEGEGHPEVSYDESGLDGHLSISQNEGRHIRLGHEDNRWDLRLNNDAIRELRLQMGAGQGTLNLNGISLKRLEVEIGAGEIVADLTGDWKQDVDVSVQGGVGSATIRLPRNIGVRVHAEGGIGSISVGGLRHDGDYYVNDAYGKSPVTMKVTVEGGIGEIRLRQGP